MELEERLNKLEDAHRALAAQHMALMQICRALLPLMPAPESDIRRAMLAAYDSLNEHMDKHTMDGVYQQDARQAIDGLTSSISAGEGMRAQNRNRS